MAASRGRMRLGLAALVLCSAAMAADGLAWRGPGWYHVLQTPAGPQLQSGPYPTELACKKAMNSSDAAHSCRELRVAPS